MKSLIKTRKEDTKNKIVELLHSIDVPFRQTAGGVVVDYCYNSRFIDWWLRSKGITANDIEVYDINEKEAS